MVNKRFVATTGDDPPPLHELSSQILASDKSSLRQAASLLPVSGTMQQLNQRLALRVRGFAGGDHTFGTPLTAQPVLDFINYNLRGIGQVVFANNPLSGLIILAALFIQSPWVAVMSLVGVVASTVTAIWLRLNRDTIRNGIFGYNGILVGALRVAA